MAPPRHADSLAPDYGQGRPLRLRAGGRPRLATAPHSRGPARGALRFSGPVLGRRPSALFALEGCGGRSVFSHWRMVHTRAVQPGGTRNRGCRCEYLPVPDGRENQTAVSYRRYTTDPSTRARKPTTAG